MQIGIKVGPRDGIEILAKSQAKLCEVWYRVDKKPDYQDLFAYCRQNKIRFGLHFWGMVRGKYFPNLVYSSMGIAEESYNLMRQTLTDAAESGAFYVNAHPESYQLMGLDLDHSEIALIEGYKVNKEEGWKSLLFWAEKLKERSAQLGVDFYLETVPLYVPSSFREGEKQVGRLNPLFADGIGLAEMLELGRKGFSLCYDFGHIVGQFPNEERTEIYRKMLKFTQEIRSFVKLVHVNTTCEPLNGTDSHNGILKADFAQDVFPDKEQFLKLMNLLKKDDLLLIPEPQQNRMIENYQELVKLFA